MHSATKYSMNVDAWHLHGKFPYSVTFRENSLHYSYDMSAMCVYVMSKCLSKID